MKKVINKPFKRCWDCMFAEYFDCQWNKSIYGEPLTKHCHYDPNDVKRGILESTKACRNYKERR